jgi:hypothetical protein
MDDITIVSALFSLKKNKYNSMDIYKFWGSNLLSNVNKNFVIFTDEENYDFICSLRTGELKEKTMAEAPAKTFPLTDLKVS